MDEQRMDAQNPADLPLSLDVVQLIDQARDESARCHHEYVGTEHLMLAMSLQDDAATPLRALGVERRQVYTLIDETIRRGSHPVASHIERPFTCTSRNRPMSTFR